MPLIHDPDRHHLRSIRLRGYDYSSPGIYFVTICAKNRECLFGEVVNGEMRLNVLGNLISATWHDIPSHNSGITLDEFIIMPNHIHGIITIVGAGSKPAPATGAGLEPAPTGTGVKLSEIVRQLKTFSARRINRSMNTPQHPLWQRNYYEHVVRGEDELNRIREYIHDNPANWSQDSEHPDNVVGKRPYVGTRRILPLLLFTGLLACKVEIERTNPLDQKNPTTHGNPYNLTVVNQYDGILLTWQAPGGGVDCPQFNIYRIEGKTGKTEEISTQVITSWLDTTIKDGESYTYKVACIGTPPQGSAKQPVVEAVFDRDNDGKPDRADDDWDNDGVTNTDEIAQDSDPEDKSSLPPDKDNDGIYDFRDIDWDNDGITNMDEFTMRSDPFDKSSLPTDSDHDGLFDFRDRDRDGDGQTNAFEKAHGSDPDASTDLVPDTDKDNKFDFEDDDIDGDGVSNDDEIAKGSDPTDKSSLPPDLDNDGIFDYLDDDRDGDGQSNAFETEHGSDQNASNVVVPDTDKDGIFDFEDDDIDGDGVSNTDEIAQGSDPTDKSSLPPDLDNDGIFDYLDDDRDGDGVINGEDSAPLVKSLCHDIDNDTCDECSSGSVTTPQADGLDADSDGICDAGDDDDDDDSVTDSLDRAPFDPNLCHDIDNDACDECATGTILPVNADGPDLDGDGLCDQSDTDRDGDGVENDLDSAPLTNTTCHDLDQDGCDECATGNALAVNSDGSDLDQDGLCDSGDGDRDGDDVSNQADLAPDDPMRCHDTDQDTCDECSSGSITTPQADGLDTDSDGICNLGDSDDDGDGAIDSEDGQPLDSARCHDTDQDTCDECSSGSVATPQADGLDTDSDGICDAGDDDDDDDSVTDSLDRAPFDPNLCHDIDNDACDECATGTILPVNADGPDLDGDGLCDQSDTDRDGDGVENDLDSAPLTNTTCHDLDQDGCDECATGNALAVNSDGSDLDQDGLCDSGDGDRDGDDVSNQADLAPDDPMRCHDTDQDTCDECSSGSITTPQADGLDTDSDGICNLGDSDDDGDGAIDSEDGQPLDSARCHDTDQDTCDECSSGSITTPQADGLDTDSDGICDAGDDDDDNDGYLDTADLCPSDFDTSNLNNDGDGLCDANDPDDDDDGLADIVETGTGIWVDATNDTGTDHLNDDTDGDGLLDGVETNTGIWVSVDDTGTNPSDNDSDDDNIDDGTEITNGTDPNDSNDYLHHNSWVDIAGGTFQMGSTQGGSNEQPVHQVTVSAFRLQKYEVTAVEYKACVDATVCVYNGGTSTSYTYNRTGYEDHPINYVNWSEARTYCQWLGGDLPTEAQWEFAARGTIGRTYPWGETVPSQTANNLANCSELSYCYDGYEYTAPVGSLPNGATPNGLHDLAGNIWEWTLDWYGSYSAGAVTDPTGPVDGSRRVVRGGGWNLNAGYVRSASRWSPGDNPDYGYGSDGFRCAAAAQD